MPAQLNLMELKLDAGIHLRALPVSLGYTHEEGLQLTTGPIQPGDYEMELIGQRLGMALNFLANVECEGEA